MTTTNPYRLPRVATPEHYRIFLTPNLDAATFEGRVEIDLLLHDATPVLKLNAIELELSEATVTAAGATVRSTHHTHDETFQTAEFHFDAPLPAGPATLELSFTGILNNQLHGFYRSTYEDAEGQTQVIATTQFEATDARRAFPCWDEPDFKATYKVTLTIPSHLAAYSNSAVQRDTDLGNGLRTVEFAPTMKMSTYLVAFVVGPFDATEPELVRGVPLRAVYPRGKGHLTSYPLEVARHAIEFFTDYFDLPYPGDKLDLIAIPDFAAGAMENLGLVTFREVELLIDPERASHPQVERVALVVNHEIAHMWFGDLVTMAWWEGIWLNEAFATFMESICTDHFRPQWNKWASFAPARDMALSVDSLHTTRAIEFEVVSPDDCRAMFDVLTYMKGCAVLRMLEQYLGETVFRDGIRLYLREHSYANTVTNDLWRALEESSGQPVGQIMDTWILQGGFPLVSVNDGVLSQTPFMYASAEGTSAIGDTWKVPVLSRTLGTTSITRQLLEGEPITLSTAAPALVNAGGSGFYRVAYAAKELVAIAENLHDLTEVERAGLFSDTWAAVLAGGASFVDLLQLASGLGDLDEPAAWTTVAQAIRTVERLVSGDGATALARAVDSLLRPQFERLGWTKRDGESEQAGVLRGLVIDLLGTVAKDPEVIEGCLARFDANSASGDLLDSVLAVTVRQNRPGDVDTIAARRKSAPTPQEEQTYLFAPGMSPELGVVTDLFAKCFTEVRNQDAPYLVATMVRNHRHGLKVWELLTERFDEALELFPSGSLAAVSMGLVTLFVDPAVAARVKEFHLSHEIPGGQQQVLQALERLDIFVAYASRARDVLDQELTAFVG